MPVGGPSQSREASNTILAKKPVALVGAFCAGYIYLFYVALSERPGQPTSADLWVAGIGMLLLLEATRRALGPPLMVVATVFLAYVVFGDQPFKFILAPLRRASAESPDGTRGSSR